MNRPLVAIVGRPNVGKSTLFNKIVGKRVSIIEDMPGVTRDRLYCDAEWCGYNFTLIDTGGLEIKSDDSMWQHIKKQAEVAVELAQVIIFLCDGKEGISANDIEVADFLRKSGKPIILAVNKLDNNEEDKTYDFYDLNIGYPYCISAEQSKGLGDLLDEVVSNLPKVGDDDLEKDIINIAVVGRPNAGKSSVTNRILGYDRVIVSDVAGTTRDAIDTPFEYQGQKYNIIDTAGMRKKANIDENVERYSVMRALVAIRRADVVLVVIDSSNEEISEQDVRICGYVHEQGKPSVILMNKWDKVEKDTHTINKYNAKLQEELKFMNYFLPLYVSALKGQRMDKVIETAKLAYDESSKRIPTGVLNDIVTDAILATEPPSHNGRQLKIYYATQNSINPPTFIFFVNDSKLLHFSYERYLENTLRKTFLFKGSPIKLIFRNKNEKDREF